MLPETLNIAIIGHTGWELDIEEKAPYSIAVTFEALNSNVNIYEMIKVENEVAVQVEIEQEVVVPL